MSQVSSKWTNNSNARTIRGEIAEYMSHNPKSSARMFLIPRNEFKNGEYDNTIYWDDGMEQYYMRLYEYNMSLDNGRGFLFACPFLKY